MMVYGWKEADFTDLGLRTIEVNAEILNQEVYEDRDYPHKRNFKHPWQSWSGVEIGVKIEGETAVGYRGKTVWYLPARTDKMAQRLKIEKGQALKVVKYPVQKEPEREYHRLLNEFAIQKTLFYENLAPDIFETLLVKNRAGNQVKWFDESYCHPADSVYLAQVVEDLKNMGMPQDVSMDEDYYFQGPSVEAFKSQCRQLGIKDYDIGLGNLFCDAEGMLKVVDVHKWTWLYDLRVPERPDYLQIELNNTCNAKCGMCAIPGMKRKSGMMADALFDKILDQARALGIQHIIPFLHGEPFMRADFIDKLKRINQLMPEARMDIFTNASTLTPDRVDQLKVIKNIDRLNFSFPGGDEKTYHDVTRLDFQASKAHIDYALKTLSCRMTVTMPVYEGNRHSVSDFLQLWDQCDAHSYKTYQYVDSTIQTLAPDTYAPCDRILRSMAVLWDGRVSICCLDSEGAYILGDLNNQSLQEAWQSPAAVGYRQKHIINRKYCQPCKACNQSLLPPLLDEEILTIET